MFTGGSKLHLASWKLSNNEQFNSVDAFLVSQYPDRWISKSHKRKINNNNTNESSTISNNNNNTNDKTTSTSSSTENSCNGVVVEDRNDSDDEENDDDEIEENQPSNKSVNTTCHRIMSMTAFPIENEDSSVCQHIVLCGCSDTLIRVFIYDESTNEIKEFTNLYQNSALLQITVVKQQQTVVTAPTTTKTNLFPYLLFSGGTNGAIKLWDLSPLQKIYDDIIMSAKATSTTTSRSSTSSSSTSSSTSSSSSSTSTSSGSATTSKLTSQHHHHQSMKLEPLTSIQSHQSGVDSLSIQVDDHDGSYIVVSGGDDQSIVVSTIKIKTPPSPSLSSSPSSSLSFDDLDIRTKSVDTLHTSSIKGIKSIGSYIFASGPDQLLSIWKYELERSTINIRWVSDMLVNVAHVNDLDAVFLGELDSNKRFAVVVVGQGVQITHVLL
eukprot:TRINITY_DN4287_c0_g1_i2.p1 TRINITY_DN4287_c0_g1~~TRINITY_DN4287_c0_g1_i2.p1  ORF type:complete len:438 (-),score=138.69 TRINITY_DN4287_c0_g1_i2:137-1450(-)